MVVKLQITDPLIEVSDQFLSNPYAYYKQLRDNDPVWWSEKGNYWIVTSYAECDTVLRDLRFGKTHNLVGSGTCPISCIASGLFKLIMPKPEGMLLMNPPDHTRIRSLVNKAFTPKMIETMRGHIQRTADELIDQVQSKGRMDLAADFAFPLPVIVIADMLGVPREDREKFKEWSHSLTSILEPTVNFNNFRRAFKARQEFGKYLRPLIAERRKNPQEDLISSLVQAEEQGDKLSERELFTNIVLLLVAGHETTVNLISNSMLALMTNPEQAALLKNKPELIESAVTEFLRFNGSVQIVRRIAMEDVQLGGKLIKSGQSLVVAVAAANHDPARFANPDQLDITRSDDKHLAFGMGIHHCLGWALAMAEDEIAVTTLLKRLPNMKLAIDTNDIKWRRPFSLRGPQILPVTF